MAEYAELAVLIIEDSESDAALILRELSSKGYALRHRRVETGYELKEALTEDWDIILSDFRLPQFNAITALEIVKATGKDIPFLIVSQAIGEGVAVELMRSGAVDYVMKSSLKRLSPAVEREVREARIRAQARCDAKALEESEKNFRLLAENSADMISRHTPDGVYTYVSPAFKRVLGFETDEMLGHSAYRFVHPGDLDEFQKSHARLASTKSDARVEYRLRKKDGSYMWAQSISRGLFDAVPEKIIEIQVSTRDITEERLAKAELAASELRFRKIIESSPVPHATNDAQGNVTYVNAAFIKTFGYALSDIPNVETWWLKAYPESTYRDFVVNTWNARLNNMRQKGDPFESMEVVIRCEGGAQKTVLASAVALEESDDVIHIVILYDITEQKRIESEIRESEKRVKALLDAVPDLIFRLDRQGRFLDYKADVRDLHSGAEIIGKVNRDITPPEFADLIDHQIAAALQQGTLQTFEYQLPIPGRGLRDYEARMVASGPDEVIAIARDITERKRADEQLRAQESYLASIIECQINGLVVVDAQGTITVANESAAQILELQRDGVTGRYFQEVNNWQQIDFDYNPIGPEQLPLAIVLQQLKPVRNYEHGIRLPDGTTKWLNFSASPIYDSGGRLAGAVASFIDVSEQHMARQKMFRQLERLRLQEKAINSSLSGVIISDMRLPDNPVTFVNDAFTQITGYTPKEIIGRNCRFLQGPEVNQPELDRLRQVLKDRTSGEFLLRNYRKDGTMFHAKLQLAPVKNDEGEVTHFVGIQTDISEQFEAERALNVARERMELALQGALLGLLDIDYDNGTTFYSARFAEILGYEADDLSKAFPKWQELVHGDDIADARRRKQEHLAGLRENFEAEVRMRHKDGHYVWILMRGRVVDRAADGKPRRFTGTVLDISERKEQIRKIMELSQQILNISELERAEISSELHDVIGQSLVLLKLNMLKFLRENNMRTEENERILLEPVADTLNKVRDISRRLTPSHMKKVGLQLAVEDMLESAQALSGIEIVADLAALDGFFPDNWSIPCFRIIQEAVTNALKHSGATKITVSTARLEQNLEIVIADNGKGFAEEGDANGIGFSLMRERIRGLRGHLFVSSSTLGVELHALIPAQAAEP